MDSRRHERCSEAALHDFALVTTYLPILGLTLRASLLVGFMYWCMYTVRMQMPGIIVLSASVVYLDSLLLRSQLDQAAGHLCLCALAVLTQQSARQCSDASMVALMIVDLVWSTLISAEVIGSVSGVRVHMPLHSKTVAACAFASAHVLVGCASVGVFEMLVRAVLFYVLCSLVILCAPFAPPPDRSSCSVLHLCAPVLFVHLYPTLASVLVIVGSHARLIYTSVNRRKAESSSDGRDTRDLRDPRDPRDARDTLEPRTGKLSEYSDLAAKLQAAKRAHGIP